MTLARGMPLLLILKFFRSAYMLFGGLEAVLAGSSENGHLQLVGGGSLPAGLKRKIGYQPNN
jgi:hypothetical protein